MAAFLRQRRPAFHRQAGEGPAERNAARYDRLERSRPILAAPESCHAIAQVIREAGHFQQAGEAATIAFCLSGTGYLDLPGYADTFQLEGVEDTTSVEASRS